MIFFLYIYLLLGSLISCSSPTLPSARTTNGSDPTLSITRELPEYTSDSTGQSTTIIEPTQIINPSQNTIRNPLYAYTHFNADGNRYLVGSGHLTELTPVNIKLPGIPTWLVSIPWKRGSAWAVTLDDGRVFGYFISSQNWSQVDIQPDSLTPGQPPMLVMDKEHPYLLTAPSAQSSPFTHPISINHPAVSQVFINNHEELIRVDRTSKQSRIVEDVLIDARILRDERNRLLFLSDPTEEYKHGVLGDAIEARSVTRIDNITDNENPFVIKIPEDMVIEGVAPIWADLNGDKVREIIITVSNDDLGAKILVYSEEGELLAVGPSIGRGFRWRHQIAVAPFGKNGELELVDVLTPHLDGVVEYYRWEGDQLIIVAQLRGYTSHIIGTRNLDMAVAGDFDGDGQVELILPNQELNKLAAIRRTNIGAEEVWSFALDAPMTTNISATTLEDGNMVIGVGLENGVLRIWSP